jgi:hypothetical protein
VIAWASNRFYGEVLQSTGNTWEQIAIAQGLRLNKGRLGGIENLCIPSCADGFTVNYELRWTGTGFTTIYLDNTGQQIQLSAPVSCPTYITRPYPGPYQPCDQGDGVELIQEALVYWGFLADERPQGVYRQDGYYGQKTADAVRLAQLFYGYPVDGIVSTQFYTKEFLAYLGGN